MKMIKIALLTVRMTIVDKIACIALDLNTTLSRRWERLAAEWRRLNGIKLEG